MEFAENAVVPNSSASIQMDNNIVSEQQTVIKKEQSPEHCGSMEAKFAWSWEPLGDYCRF